MCSSTDCSHCPERNHAPYWFPQSLQSFHTCHQVGSSFQRWHKKKKRIWAWAIAQWVGQLSWTWLTRVWFLIFHMVSLNLPGVISDSRAILTPEGCWVWCKNKQTHKQKHKVGSLVTDFFCSVNCLLEATCRFSSMDWTMTICMVPKLVTLK